MKPASRSVPSVEVDLDVGVAREQLVGWDLVDLREAEQAWHRDRALAALVRAEHRCLELEVGARLDVVKRKPLLPADRPEPFAYVHAMHESPLPPREFAARPGETISEVSALVDMRARLTVHLQDDPQGNPGCPGPEPRRGGRRSSAAAAATGAVTARSTCGPTASRVPSGELLLLGAVEARPPARSPPATPPPLRRRARPRRCRRRRRRRDPDADHDFGQGTRRVERGEPRAP